MILPELVDMSCMLVPAGGQQLTSPVDNHSLSQLFGLTLLPTAAASCPRLVYGYPAAYNPAASLTTPTSLTNSTLATSLATNQVTTPLTAPQLPPTLTLAQQQSVAAFQATLAGALTSQNGGASAAAGANAGHLLQTNFQSAAAANRLNFSAVANGNIAANGTYQRPVAAFGCKHGFGFKHGVKRKAEDGSEGDGKGDGKSDASGGGELMTRLYCKLCKVVLNAPAQAKQHYEGKNHARKLKMFMDGTEDSDDNGQDSQVSSTTSSSGSSDDASSSKSKTPPSPTNPDPIDPEIYCKMCGVSFNSIKQSQQHYQGKNHKKRARAIQSEANGIVKKKYGPFSCHTCRLNCANRAELEAHCTMTSHVPHINNHHLLATRNQWQQHLHHQHPHAFSAIDFKSRMLPSTLTLNPHLNHHRLTTTGLPTTSAVHHQPRLTPLLATTSSSATKPLAAPPAAKKARGVNGSSSQEFANYRLPSGKYYCSMCKQTMHGESQMASHVESNKHKAAYAVMRTEQEAAAVAKQS